MCVCSGSVRFIAFSVEESVLQQFCTSEVLHGCREMKEMSELLSFKYKKVQVSMLFL